MPRNGFRSGYVSYPSLEEVLKQLDAEECQQEYKVESLETLLHQLDLEDNNVEEAPLIRAIRQLDLFEVQALCRDKADPDTHSLSGETAIKLAVQSGDANLVALLLGWGASPRPGELKDPGRHSRATAHDSVEASDSASPIQVLCDMFADGIVQSDQQSDVLASLDPGALAQVRKKLSLTPPFALGGATPCVTLRAASGVSFEPTEDHEVRLHSVDSLRPVLSLIPRREETTAVIVLLHGFLQSGTMFLHIAREMSWAFPYARILAPTAPTRKSAFGYGPAWFDPTSTNERHAQLEEGQNEILQVLGGKSCTSVPPDRVVLAGFSLGGTLAAWIALKAPQRMAGLVLMGTPGLVEELQCQQNSYENLPGARHLPVLHCHGGSDELAPMEDAQASCDALACLGCQVRFSPHEGIGHFISAAMIAEVLAWTSEKLPP